jgi:hypothetical protein
VAVRRCDRCGDRRRCGRSRQRGDLGLAPRLLAIAGGAAAISIAVVIALDATIH